MSFPPIHPKRVELNDEVHARTPAPLATPARITHLAMFNKGLVGERDREPVRELMRLHGMEPPKTLGNHHRVELDGFRLKWERHTEFTRYVFVTTPRTEEPFAESALDALPADWVAALPGELVSAAHLALVREDQYSLDPTMVSERYFGGAELVGASIAGRAAQAFTDFRIQEDEFNRWLVSNRSLTDMQAGRHVTRLLEIDAYRIMALMAFPLARSLGPILSERENELAEITSALADGSQPDEEGLLERLTGLQADIESRTSESRYRFGASAAYHSLVTQRIGELREERIQGLQMFAEFTDRRLAPAMSTCRAVAARQESVSEHAARATNLLSTRVNLISQRTNQELLASMDRRAKLQLRLQETVEGLSVAALTYYIVGLVGYAARGAEALGSPLNPYIVMTASIPIVALAVAMGVRRIRKMVAK